MPTFYLNGPAALPTPTVKLISATNPATTVATLTPTESPAGVYTFTTSETGLLLVQVLSGSTPVGSGLETLGAVDKWIWEAVRLDASQPDYAPAKAGNAMALLAGTRDAVAEATAIATGMTAAYTGTLTAVNNGTGLAFGGTLATPRASTNVYASMTLEVTSGAATGQRYNIATYDASNGKFTLSKAWATAPSSGDSVAIWPAIGPVFNSVGAVTHNLSQSEVWTSTAITAMTGSTITLLAGPATDAALTGQVIRITAGNNIGQTRTVTAYNAGTGVATLSSALPNSIAGSNAERVSVVFPSLVTTNAPTTSEIATAVATALAGQAITITFPQQVGANIAIVQSTDSYEIAVTNPGSGAWPSDVSSRQIWFYAQSKSDPTQRIATQGSYSSSAARVTVSRTASNVTPGVYEWRLEAVAGDGTRSPLLTKPGELRIYDDLRG